MTCLIAHSYYLLILKVRSPNGPYWAKIMVLVGQYSPLKALVGEAVFYFAFMSF